MDGWGADERENPVDTEMFLASLAGILKVLPGSIKGEDQLDQCAAWDSLAVVTFMTMANSKFGVRVSPPAVIRCKTVADLMRLVAKP